MAISSIESGTSNTGDQRRWHSRSYSGHHNAAAKWEAGNTRQHRCAGAACWPLRILVDESVHLIFHFLLLFFLSLPAVTAAVPGSLRLGRRFTNVVAVLEDVCVTRARTGPETRDSIV